MSLSPLLWHYEAVWRLLAFRTDIDDLIVELLGRLSLERIYADSDRRAYSQLVLTLLVQLNSVFSLQRLYLPKDKQPSTRSLSYLVSWEVTIRTVEAVVQLVVDGKESLWEIHGTICNALGRFLLSALRVLALHPKPTGIFDFTHRDRVARLHTLLELVCDNYPDSSDLLLVCREVTRSLSDNPYSLTPPTWLRCQLASLKTKLVCGSVRGYLCTSIVDGNVISSIHSPTACRPIMLRQSFRRMIPPLGGYPSSWPCMIWHSSSSEP